MMKTNPIGIWTDHSNAQLIVFKSGAIETKIIDYEFTHEDKRDTLHKGQKAMHHKEQHEELAYYKAIAAEIKQYHEVL